MQRNLLAVVSIAVVASLLLTGCAKARERRESRDATQTAQEDSVPPASTPDATVAPTSRAGTATRVPATRQPAATAKGSSGCGMAAETGSSVRSIESDGIERSYRLYVPVSYKPASPTPLVLNYHGYGANALEQERYAEMPAAADKYGFIVATPEGTGQPQEWYLYGPVEDGYVDDFAFTNQLIDELSASLCIDQSRIYATGISNGGGMTSLVGCELNDRIAAIAPVAGEPYAELRCAGKGPMPVIAFHGTDDPLVPFGQEPDVGRLDIFRFGARENTHDWAEHNGCDMTLKTERIADDVVLESYGGCEDGADVQLYVVEGGGHTWPGGRIDVPGLGVTTHSIDSTELAWQFFAAHPKR